MYLIKNIAKRDAKLFFAQARKVPLDEMDLDNSSRRTESVAPRSQSSAA